MTKTRRHRMKADNKDKELAGNEKIEEYIAILQKEPSEEMLAVVLSTIRRRMREGGEFVVAVDPSIGGQFQIQAMELENGEKWMVAFTSFEEQMKGNTQVMSTFMAKIDQLFDMALAEKSVKGLLLNPWNRTIMLDKELLGLIKGEICK